MGALFLSLTALPTRIIGPLEKRWYLADERTFYPLASFSPIRVGSVYTAQADGLVDALVSRGARPKIAVGCVGIVGYETRLPIFDMLGLTEQLGPTAFYPGIIEVVAAFGDRPSG